MKAVYDTIIIGGGQAGLAVGYYLSQQGRDFVILEAHEQIGDSWRQRWDSLQLFTPAKFSSLPGMPFPDEALHYPTKDEMADYLETYAQRFNLPVKLGTSVKRLSREDDRFVVASGEQRLTARQVVVATGAYQSPRIPTFAKHLDPGIYQVHTKHYRNPSQLPKGETLVVGVGNSGGEIAMELAQTRRVWLSGKPSGQLPKPKNFLINLTLVVHAQRHSGGHPLWTVLQGETGTQRCAAGRIIRKRFRRCWDRAVNEDRRRAEWEAGVRGRRKLGCEQYCLGNRVPQRFFMDRPASLQCGGRTGARKGRGSQRTGVVFHRLVLPLFCQLRLDWRDQARRRVHRQTD